MDGDKGKEEFCQNANSGMTREPDNHGENNKMLDEWARLQTSAKDSIKDLTHFNPGNRPLHFNTGSWGDEVETLASDSWSEWLGGENSEKRKATNRHEREDSQARKQPRLTDEWTGFFSKAGKLSKKKKKKCKK